VYHFIVTQSFEQLTGPPDFPSCHWIHSLCILDRFRCVCVRFICLCFYCLDYMCIHVVLL